VKWRTIFLDAGGVLVHPDWSRVSKALAPLGLRLDPARLSAAEPRAMHDLDSEHTIRTTDDASRWAIFFHRTLVHAGASVTKDSMPALLEELRRVHERDNLWEAVFEEVPRALERLTARGHELVVVSNSNGTVRAKLERVGLGKFFALVIDSHEERVEKPDPEIFHIALERSGSSAENTLHVGDLYHIDVVGARAAGLQAILLDRGDLHEDRDCLRIANLTELADLLDRELP
jgi:putative hydrolase of the HAD superfamily